MDFLYNKMDTTAMDFLYNKMDTTAMALVSITATMLMGSFVYLKRPSLILQAYIRFAVRWSGMKIRSSAVLPDGFQFHYGEKGARKEGQMSFVFLHGFSADHFMWAPIVQKFPSSLHVIAVDLPGHGFTMEPLKGEELHYGAMVGRLAQLFDLLHLDSPVHLVGISMGATLGGLYAGRYPGRVGALTLVCPSMKTPEEGHIFKANRATVLEDGALTVTNCPMLPQDASGVKVMLGLSHYRTVDYPGQILQGVADLRKQKNLFYVKLVNMIISEPNQLILEHNLGRVRCPTQVVWGEEDQIVHVSGVETVRRNLPDCRRVDILSQCGHAINLDQPGRFAEIVLDFWQDIETERSRML